MVRVVGGSECSSEDSEGSEGSSEGSSEDSEGSEGSRL